MRRCLRVLLLVTLLVSFQPSCVYADVTFTDEQYEELQQTLEQLQELNSDNQNIVTNLQQMNEQLQSSYKKQKTYWIVGSILTTVSVGITCYYIGVGK